MQESNKIEFKTRTAVRKNGSIGVPRYVRDKMGLEHGTPVTMYKMGNSIIIEPEYFTCPCCHEHVSQISETLNICGDCLVSLEKVRKDNPDKSIADLMDLVYTERGEGAQIE